MAGRPPLRQGFPAVGMMPMALQRPHQRKPLGPLPPPIAPAAIPRPPPPSLPPAPTPAPTVPQLTSMDEFSSITQFLEQPEVLRQLDEQERLLADAPLPVAVKSEEPRASVDPLDALADVELPDAPPVDGAQADDEPPPPEPEPHLPPPPAPHTPPRAALKSEASLQTPPGQVEPRSPPGAFSPPVGAYPRTSLQYWGVSAAVAAAYQAEHVGSMYEWQVACLTARTRPGVKEPIYGGNLVYSAPTSSGKSLVAELLVLRTVEQRKLTAIIALPFVAMVTEKYHFLSKARRPPRTSRSPPPSPRLSLTAL